MKITFSMKVNFVVLFVVVMVEPALHIDVNALLLSLPLPLAVNECGYNCGLRYLIVFRAADRILLFLQYANGISKIVVVTID